MTQLWSIASRERKEWELVQKIISCDVVRPALLAPGRGCGRGGREAATAGESAANFTHIGGVPDAMFVPLLHGALSGHASLQRLDAGLVLARMQVQVAILSDTNVDECEWDAAQKKLPLACQNDFVDGWTHSVVLGHWGIQERGALPELFFQDLARRVESDRLAAWRLGGGAAAVQVLININAGVCRDVGGTSHCRCDCVQALPDGVMYFSRQLHDSEVKVFCHDVLHMAQLQGDIAQPFGLLPTVFCAQLFVLVV